MSSRIERIPLLLAPLGAEICEIRDDSARHHGHAGASGGEHTHLTLLVVAQAFAHSSRIQRHRMVMDLLKDEFANGLHALNIKAFSIDEYQQSEDTHVF